MFDDIIKDPKQIPKSVVAKDMADLIRRAPFTESELVSLYEAIRGRLRSKNCSRCRLLKVEGFEGSVREWVGFGRQFLCVACQYILNEKGKIE